MTSDGLFALLASAPCGVCVMSLDQTIVFWNRAAQSILGYSPDRVLGQRCYEVQSGLDPGGFTPECVEGCSCIRHLRAGLVPAATQLHMTCASGERKWVNVTPMVVSGILQGSPLLAYLFEDGADPVSAEHVSDLIRSARDQGYTGDEPEVPVATSPAGEAPALTPRERQVLRLVALGWETDVIAHELGISPNTARNHITNLRKKLDANSRLDAVMAAIRLGLLSAG